MCRFCNGTPLRLLTQPMRTFAEVDEAKHVLATLNKLADSNEAAERAYYHVQDVVELRLGNYSEAKKVIEHVR